MLKFTVYDFYNHHITIRFYGKVFKLQNTGDNACSANKTIIIIQSAIKQFTKSLTSFVKYTILHVKY